MGEKSTQPWDKQYGLWTLLSMFSPYFASGFKAAKPNMYGQVFGHDNLTPEQVTAQQPAGRLLRDYDPWAAIAQMGRPGGPSPQEQQLLQNSLFGLAAPFPFQGIQSGLNWSGMLPGQQQMLGGGAMGQGGALQGSTGQGGGTGSSLGQGMGTASTGEQSANMGGGSNQIPLAAYGPQAYDNLSRLGVQTGDIMSGQAFHPELGGPLGALGGPLGASSRVLDFARNIPQMFSTGFPGLMKTLNAGQAPGGIPNNPFSGLMRQLLPQGGGFGR